jgi:galactose mutarotase-like enzyme
MGSFELNNDYIKIEVNSFGAELKSLKKVHEDIEYLWQADGKYWNRTAPVLFPIVGRLKNDEYLFNNTKYKMTQHGFARDYDFELISKTDESLKFLLCENEETLKKYPFNFTLEISYKLIDSTLIVSYEVKNQNQSSMYFSIGAHPAFNWPFGNEEKDSYYFEFESISSTKRHLLNIDGLLTSSRNININENKLFIDDKTFNEDALIFNDKNIQTISLKSLQNNKSIKMNFKGFEYLGLWSKPSGAPFVCIEPWHGVADRKSTNQNLEKKEGILKLQKDEIFSSSYSIEI